MKCREPRAARGVRVDARPPRSWVAAALPQERDRKSGKARGGGRKSAVSIFLSSSSSRRRRRCRCRRRCRRRCTMRHRHHRQARGAQEQANQRQQENKMWCGAGTQRQVGRQVRVFGEPTPSAERGSTPSVTDPCIRQMITQHKTQDTLTNLLVSINGGWLAAIADTEKEGRGGQWRADSCTYKSKGADGHSQRQNR